MTFANAGYWGPEPILDTSGQPVDNASLYVYTDSARTQLASLYTDTTKGTAASNPVASDPLGNYTVWAAPGLYYTKAVWANQTVNSTILVQPYPSDIQPSGAYVSAIVGPVASGDTTGATDTPALQAWLNSCVSQNKLGVLPPGHYYDTGLTISGSARLLGLGVTEAYTGGTNGDTALAGPKIQHVATSGDHLLVTPPSTSTRGHFICDGITWIGNGGVGGVTGGGGVHLYANATTSGLIVDTQRCSFIGAYGDNLVIDGNVFESRLGKVDCNQSSTGRGLVVKSSAGGGVPGEIHLDSVTCDSNATTGADFSGGGSIIFTRLSCTNNSGQGLVANGIFLTGRLLVLESNGPTSFATLTNLTTPPVIEGIIINYGSRTSATGIICQSVLWGRFIGWNSNSGAGNLDWTTDGGCQGCEFGSYSGGGFNNYYSDGGYYTQVHQGEHWFTPRGWSVATATLASTGSITPDSTKNDKLLITVTGSAAALTVANPIMNAAASKQTGQRLTVWVRNNAGGAMGTITFGAAYLLAGGTALTAPANGKRRGIEFEYDNATSNWVEAWRSTADT